MKTLRTTVTSKGQITLPKSLRDSLGIRTSDQVEFSVNPSGKAEMKKLQPAGASAGVLHHLAPSQPVSINEMNQSARRAAADRHSK